MTRYSHRNGETEPPTVNGWYAYDGEHRNAKFGGKMIDEGVTSRGFLLVDGDEYYRFVWEGDDDQTIADYTGQWYGPIVAPWEQPQPAMPADVRETIVLLLRFAKYGHAEDNSIVARIKKALAYLGDEGGRP